MCLRIWSDLVVNDFGFELGDDRLLSMELWNPSNNKIESCFSFSLQHILTLDLLIFNPKPPSRHNHHPLPLPSSTLQSLEIVFTIFLHPPSASSCSHPPSTSTRHPFHLLIFNPKPPSRHNHHRLPLPPQPPYSPSTSSSPDDRLLPLTIDCCRSRLEHPVLGNLGNLVVSRFNQSTENLQLQHQWQEKQAGSTTI
ncbi:hypothetical protein L1987_03212 [Smallanthus sonchifolius]|uniref:Uncharacterized protein n=1 Tax=Smallanthus sonchifolius TaxID=185202 RepID=A0ACB9KA23_9ASTR|nr:hypothetical protein L1987_03212 [Smallanthus sonchifolius]